MKRASSSPNKNRRSRQRPRDWGWPEQTLRYWLIQRGWSPEQSSLPGQLAESEDPRWLKTRIRDLEQKLRRAEMEREILKKATAFFANQPQ
jgi:transposase-like protein